MCVDIYEVQHTIEVSRKKKFSHRKKSHRKDHWEKKINWPYSLRIYL